MTRYLIVNADDYGLTPGVAQGIREAHLGGIVTSTTAMMNMPGVEGALREAEETCPRLGLGVHLTLTSGAPLLPVERVRSLVDANGRFVKLAPFRARLAALVVDEVRAEWSAQIEKFCAVLGHPPDHLDSHHHTSYMTPALFQVMLDLATQYNCPIRSVLPDNLDEPEQTVEANDPAAEHALEAAVHLPADSKVKRPEHMVISFYDDGATLEHLLITLNRLPEGVTEIMSHPAYVDDALLAISSYNQARAREYGILTNPAVKAAIAAPHIRLVTFSALGLLPG